MRMFFYSKAYAKIKTPFFCEKLCNYFWNCWNYSIFFDIFFVPLEFFKHLWQKKKYWTFVTFFFRKNDGCLKILPFRGYLEISSIFFCLLFFGPIRILLKSFFRTLKNEKKRDFFRYKKKQVFFLRIKKASFYWFVEILFIFFRSCLSSL